MHQKIPVTCWKVGSHEKTDDFVAEECAVALTYNRQAHVVMMATPADLEDFALGFSLSEGIVRDVSELLSIRTVPREQGIEVAVTVTDEVAQRLREQRRNLTGRTGCGLCGAESIEQAMRPPFAVTGHQVFSHEVIQRAVGFLAEAQPLQAITGAVHCAAWFDSQGELCSVREDVGRHNALDKLIGCLKKTGADTGPGFVVVSSRASYEMVYKAAAAGAEMLVAVSAPTELAINYALRAGLTLVGFARPGRHNVYTFPERLSAREETEADA
jgi:FdhD protein